MLRAYAHCCLLLHMIGTDLHSHYSWSCSLLAIGAPCSVLLSTFGARTRCWLSVLIVYLQCCSQYYPFSNSCSWAVLHTRSGVRGHVRTQSCSVSHSTVPPICCPLCFNQSSGLKFAFCFQYPCVVKILIEAF